MNMIRLAKRLDNVSEYIFARLEKDLAEVEKKSKRKVLNLSIGSPDIPPKKIYIEKLVEFILSRNSHLYPGHGASEEFLNAVKGWYKKKFNVVILEDEILQLLGAKDGISHLPL